MRPAILRGCMKIPVEHIDTEHVKEQCTYRFMPMGAEEERTVEAWYYDGDYLCIPRQLGLRICNQLQIDVVDETSTGHPAYFPKEVTPRDYQVEALEMIEHRFKSLYDFIFRAHTGFGKTACALIIASRLGLTTLVVVDQENLKAQWIEALVKLFGFQPGDIGIIQGKKCDYQGKAVVVAMIQTLSQKKFKDEVYDYFGFMIADEVHVAGAPTFSSVLMQFSAAYRLGISATPCRRDGLQRALDHNLGGIRVVADKEHEKSAVYIIRSKTVYSWYANVSSMVGRILSEIEEDGPRNLTIAEAVLWLYESGRDVLVLGDRIDQLKNIKSLLFYMGLEDSEVGLYTGFDPVYIFNKDPKPSRKPKYLHRWVDEDGVKREAEYCAVNVELQRKRISKDMLRQIKETCPIILATYKMFQKGVDVPRLSGGIDATPRSTAEQVQGRILREEEGKPTPIWVTIVDDNNYRLTHSFAQRIGEYLNNNTVFFEWDEDGGLTEWDATELRKEARKRTKELKSMQIEQNSDGHNMLLTPKLQKQRKREQDRAIEKRIRARRQSRST